MNFTLQGLIQAVVDTIRDPRDGARQVMSLDLSRQDRWLMLALIVVLSTLLALISMLMSGETTAVIAGPLTTSPIALGGVQFLLLAVLIYGIDAIGRRMGGKGGLDDAISLVVWLQFIMICIQIVQMLAVVVLPPFAVLIGFASLIIFFWLLVNFIAELHGFQSSGAVFMVLIISLIVFAILLSILLAMLGISVPGGIENV